ncbi:unnamed protein product [Schistocephalus solidus]|uniref:Ubiquitin-like domain-containing protein n=1 Tax=Schistocephalus solidus TaxID=70667 RepID=A0A183SBF4_SCHSO|nr:unnamed protein product [Schistocephalus solidus]
MESERDVEMPEDMEVADPTEDGNVENPAGQSEYQPEVQVDAASAHSTADAANATDQIIPITVMLPNSEPVNLSVHPDRPVRELQERINEIAQSLKDYDIIYSAKKLEPDKTLADYKVQKSSTLWVHETPTALPNPSPDVKEEGRELANAGLKNVTVVMPDRSRVDVNVEPGMTVGDLNRKLAEQQGIAPNGQCLIHSGQQMENHRYLKEYQIPEGSVIFVHRPQSNPAVQRQEEATNNLEAVVVVRGTGNRLRLPINPRSSNPMQDLSKQIEAATRIPAKEQEILFKGQSIGPGENLFQKKEFLKKPLVEVKRRVLDEMQIFLRNIQGKTKVVQTRSSATVRDLKESVRGLEGIPVNDQVLTCQGRFLQDMSTLKQSGVVDGSTIQLTTRFKGGLTRLAME